MIYIVDSHSWIEYFMGSESGEKLSFLFINPKNRFVTMECSLAEVKGWARREDHNFDKLLKIIKVNSVLFPVLQENWLIAADIKHELRKERPHFGIIDAVLVSKQHELGCKIISGDPHFKNMKDVVYIGK